MLTVAFAALHYLALGIGVAGIWIRARGFRARDLATVFYGDNLWGIAALLWIGTGLGRAFGGLEKGTDWYLHNPMFHVKMGLFGLAALLELWPMVTLIRWRIRKDSVDMRLFPTFARISIVELVILGLIPFAASAMARGVSW